MLRSLVVTVPAAAILVAAPVAAQVRRYPLEATDGLRPHNVSVQPAVLQGKKGLRVTEIGGARGDGAAGPQLVVIQGLQFGDGVIEAELAGAPAPGAHEGARGFVGIAFRVQDDLKSYDAIYLRPTNGRAEDQERRNHAVQYVWLPDWPWSRLRQEFPSRYESYVDLLPNVWTKVKIEVRGERARLFVHEQEQPTLVVNDVKSGAKGKGGVALMIDRGTVAHFRNLRVRP